MKIFVSFASPDEDSLRHIIEEMRSRGIDVFWSADSIPAGRKFDNYILHELEKCRYVVPFLSPSMDSSLSDWVAYECSTARQLDKLIPVIIGRGVANPSLKVATALVQGFKFESFDQVINQPDFERLIASCGGKVKKIAAASAIPQTPAEAVEAWYDGLEADYNKAGIITAMAYRIAVATFDDGIFAGLDDSAQSLARLIADKEGVDLVLPDNYPERLSAKLKLIEAQLVPYENPSTHLTEEIIGFKSNEIGEYSLLFFWREFSKWREPLLDWYSDITNGASSDMRSRISFALGILGQVHFRELMNSVYVPWLRMENSNHMLVADDAISIASYNQHVANAIRNDIRSWASGADPVRQKMAVNLACGMTGMRMPSLALECVKRVGGETLNKDKPDTGEKVDIDETSESNEKPAPTGRLVYVDVFDTMRIALKRRLNMKIDGSEADSESSVYMLNGFLHQFSDWILEGEDETTDDEAENTKQITNVYAILLFLLMLDGLPIRQPKKINRKRFSLQSISDNEKTLMDTSKVLNKALGIRSANGIELRAMATAIIKDWLQREHKANQIDKSSNKPNAIELEPPLRALAKTLIVCAKTQREVDRIVYMFRSSGHLDQLEFDELQIKGI